MRRRRRSDVGRRAEALDALEDYVDQYKGVYFALEYPDPVAVRRRIRELEDRRRFHPDPYRPPAASPRRGSRLLAKTVSVIPGVEELSYRLGFAIPERVAVCVRRKERREVLHAFGRTGSGVSRRRRRTIWSDVDC